MDTVNVSAEMNKALTALKYEIRENLALYDRSALQRVDIVGFGSKIPSQKSLCIIGHACPSVEREKVLETVCRVGARYAYLGHEDYSGRLYAVDPAGESGGVTPTPIHDVAVGDIAGYLIAHAERYGPDQVIREKFRALPERSRVVEPWQLSFAAAGLLDFQEEQTEDSLVKLLHRCTAAAVAAWKAEGGVPDDADAVVGRVFLRLVAACALAHKRITHVDPTDEEATVRAAHEVLPSFIDRNVLTSVSRRVLDTLWSRLQELRFELLTGDMLAGIYARGLLAPEEQRKHGIYYTPPSVRRFLWNEAVELLREFPQDERIVLDPTCGSGGFLLTAYEGLARLEDVNLLLPHDPGAFRWRILGIDQDAFACDIARLALILESQPTTNGWSISPGQFQDWEPPLLQHPRLLIGNPPFGQQQAVAVFQRALDWVVPGGVVALVMPRSFLTNVRSQSAREDVAGRAEILSVRELPDGVFGGSQASTCTVVARRRHERRSWTGEKLAYGALNVSLTPSERRTRFAAGDRGFMAPDDPRSVGDFVVGTGDLAFVWDSLRETRPASTVVEIHRGVLLRENKDKPGETPAVVADISQVPKPGYLPYVADAKHHIEPFAVVKVCYLEWTSDTEKIPRPRKMEWWCPGKVLLYRHVTHKQRWRLIGAVDDVGLAYADRVLGCFPRGDEWSTAALLCLFASNYANAWYSTHSQQPYVIPEILYRMPVPNLGEDDIEHLTALGRALGACAHDAAGSTPSLGLATYAYTMRLLLHQVDRVICSGIGIGMEHEEEINRFLADGGKERPGLPPVPQDSEPLCLADRSSDDAGRLLVTTGLVLAVDPERERTVVWLDSLDLRVPVCLPLEWLPPEARFGGKAIKARVNVAAPSLEQVLVKDIAACPEAHLPRETLAARLEALLSDSSR